MHGSKHRMTDGYGCGQYVPSDKAFYNMHTARPGDHRRPTNQTYRRDNSLVGIETHRSDISYGHTVARISTGPNAERLATLHATMLTSGEV
ncbi:hypothetical protein JKP88DRAFT_153010, partial [Tribonema minus]